MRTQVKKNNYIVATQDREIQEWLRLRPGQPIMYLHNRTPVLEQPSDVSKKFIQKKLDKSLDFNKDDETKLSILKKNEGMSVTGEPVKKLKKFKIKHPNPLSCKKKKKAKALGHAVANAGGSITKKARSRVKIPKHVKEILKS